MNKGVFSTWLKELCALVFVQTIQAFILAIVLSIMLTFLLPYKTPDGKASVTSQDSVSALGVLCIVLLTSLTKIEQITKKIFGLDSSFMQHKPPHGLLTSFLALKAASRALNNIPKIAGGIGKVAGSRLDKKKAQNANLTRLKRAGLDASGNPISGSNNDGAAGADANQSEQPLASPEYSSNSFPANSQGPRTGSYPNAAANSGVNMPSTTSTSNNSKPKDVSKEYWKIMDKYDDELAKAKAKQNEGWKDILSGATETAGAITGAFGGLGVGLTTGLATGDLDQIPKAIGFGVGIGDTVGKSVIDAGDAVMKRIQNIESGIKTTSQLNKNLSRMEKSLQIQKKNKIMAETRLKNIQNAIQENNNINDL